MRWKAGNDTDDDATRPGDGRFLRGRSQSHPLGPARDVEAQQLSPSSLLNQVRRQLVLRRQHSALTDGEVATLQADGPQVLAFLRHNANQCLLCVHNMGAAARTVRIELPERYNGAVPFEVSGRVSLPPVTSGACAFRLQAYEFFWFELRSPEVDPA